MPETQAVGLEGSPKQTIEDHSRGISTPDQSSQSWTARKTPLFYLIQGFRLVTGAPKSVEEIDKTPILLRGVIDTIAELARRVRTGEISTGDRNSTIKNEPAFLTAQTASASIPNIDEYKFDARVSRVQIEKLVKDLRELGFDAIGIPMPGTKPQAHDAVQYCLLRIRGGFDNLDHLVETTDALTMPSFPWSAVSQTDISKGDAPKASHANGAPLAEVSPNMQRS